MAARRKITKRKRATVDKDEPRKPRPRKRLVRKRTRKTVKQIEPAMPDEDGRMPKRISRKRRILKRPRTERQAKKRQDVALAKEHPNFKIEGKQRKRMSVELAEALERGRAISHVQGIINERLNKLTQELRDSRAQVGIARRWWKDLYDHTDERYPRGVPVEMVLVRLKYECLVRGYQAAGFDPPITVQQNHRAAVAFRLSDFTDSMRSLLETRLAYPERVEEDDNTEETDNMAASKKTTRKKAPSKGKGTSVAKGMQGAVSGLKQGEAWTAIFRQNFSAKLTDEQLAAAMAADFPQSPRCAEVKTIRQHRSLFNKGKLPGQDGPPAKELSPFDAEGNKLAKNYREGSEPLEPARKKAARKKAASKKAGRKKAAAKGGDDDEPAGKKRVLKRRKPATDAA